MSKTARGRVFSAVLACIGSGVCGGCSAADQAAKAQDSGFAADIGGDGGVEATDTGIVPTWWRLDADLRVAAGQLSASGSEITIQVLGEQGEALCVEQMRVASTDTIPTEPDPSIYTWWALQRGAGSGECEGVADLSALPASIHVGVGALHPELEAVAGQLSGLPETGPGTLNGAYARIDADQADVWVFGFAGDPDAWLGTAGPATVAPLSDGIWTIRGAYSFPLP